MSLVAEPHLAEKILQRTNVVLWEKSQDFQPGTNFQSWAYKVVQFEVLTYRKRAGRERHLFDSELLDTLACEAEQHAGRGFTIKAL
ncbi:MAG: hypothetical protein KTR15_07875 [Phycisphaeraceae bacterium]|nr:hypothetical protein [Phycisphaeraceae bacterium]